MRDGLIRVDDEEVVRVFGQLLRAAGDPAPALKSVGVYEVDETRERIFREEDPSGQRWAPLAPSTVRRKGHAQMLVQSHALVDGLHSEVEGQALAVGTDRPYARRLQYGDLKPGQSSTLRASKRGPRRLLRDRKADAGKGGTPPRPFLGWNEKDRREVLRVFAAHIRKAMR